MKNKSQVTYRKIKVSNAEIFYREAGKGNKETILFLHGFPSSSFMYRNIMNKLGTEFHVIAPDYPGFGLSSILPVSEFEYTFDNIALVMQSFIEALGITKLSLYIQDYGAPVGFRIATKKPELIKNLIIQNANAYNDGLGPGVKTIGALIDSRDENGLNAAIDYMISYQGIKEEYLNGAENADQISPEAYIMDSYFMEREGVREIQHTLFKNYGANFPKYPEWQAYLRKHQPNTLIIWGKNDKIFTQAGAEAYKRDLPNSNVRILNGGHFALEEHYLQITEIIRKFLSDNK
jgi:pimeloyl-ACP methyl ester carboxylesterase